MTFLDMRDFSDFGAHEEAAKQLHDLIKAKISLGSTSGHIIVKGITGGGKTYLVKKLCKKLSLPFRYVRAGQLYSNDIGEMERALARELSGEECIIVFDEFEAIGMAPPQPAADYERRVLVVLKHFVDSRLKSNQVIIGITTAPEDLDVELLRNGRFPHQVQVTTSKDHQRRLLLRDFLSSEAGSLDKVIDEVVKETQTYTAADLKELCSLVPRPVTLDGFKDVMKTFVPTVTRGIPSLPEPSIKVHLVGLDDLKQQIINAITMPWKKAELFKKLDMKPLRGVLLYGPSGVGKTTLALQCAHEAGLTLIQVSATSIRSKYVGQSEKNLADVFRRARECAPCILFIDQIEALVGKRGQSSGSSENTMHRLITCMLTELDGVLSGKSGDGVFVLATTWNKDDLDEAILRPGRIGLHFELGHPDAAARRQFFTDKMQQYPVQLSDDDLDKLVEMTDGWSGADLSGLYTEAVVALAGQSSSSGAIDELTLQFKHLQSVYHTMAR